MFFGTRSGHRFDEFEAAVHSPARASHRRNDCANLVTGRAAKLKVFGENVGGAHPEVRPEEVGALAREFGEIALELGLAVAPGEIGVALLEADFCEGVHHRWSSECLGQEDHIFELRVHLGNQPLPKVHRLGVWVIDPKHLDSERNPVLDHAQNLEVDAVAVVVEVDRVNVLILLRRVFGVGDGSVGASGEPLGVGLYPRMIWRSL